MEANDGVTLFAMNQNDRKNKSLVFGVVASINAIESEHTPVIKISYQSFMSGVRK